MSDSGMAYFWASFKIFHSDEMNSLQSVDNGQEEKESTDTSECIPSPKKRRKHTCGICGLFFDRPSRLKNHSIIHKDPSEVRMYKCEKCPFQTKHITSLNQHDLNIHGTRSTFKKYSCQQCDYQSNAATRLKKHIFFTHSPLANTKKGKIIHKCKHCGHIGKDKERLTRHLLIHEEVPEEDMFKCTLCPYKSKRKAALKNHMLVHKSSSETTVFKCELCSYETKWRHCLRNHLKVHEKNLEQLTIRKCDICDFTTNNIYSLEMHVKSHVEKPKKSFTCHNCGYNTNDKSTFIRHTRIHRPLWQLEFFECATCGVRLKEKRSLRNHIISSHGVLANVESSRAMAVDPQLS